MKIRHGAVLLLLAVNPVMAQDEDDVIDEIIVADQSVSSKLIEVAVDQKMLVDTAMALKALPGADVNRNGAITGVAQYRGMYGDRVAITIDNHAVVSGGPNAMDAPLSYVSPMIAESLAVERGIASVSSAPESIGGHLSTRLARGQFGGDTMSVSGFIGSRYSSNGNLHTTAGRFTVSDRSHRLSLIAELDSGGNQSTPVGTIQPSMLDRERYDVSYAFTNGDSHVVVFAGKLETTDSGTPALPMDIGLIDTNLAGSHFLYAMTPQTSIEGHVAVNNVDHLMDNFSLRAAPPAMAQRLNTASGNGESYSLAGRFDLGGSYFRLGVDGVLADHDSTITNPTNPMFRIANFSDVHRDLMRVFAEWTLDIESAELEMGLSAKRVETDAGAVSFAGIMAPAAQVLADDFNAGDRDLRFDDVDVVAKYRFEKTSNLEWRAEIASKSRAPSYQELYLWLPMQATGGLADGRTYVGDRTLESERSNEINLGFQASSDRFSLSPQVFFKDISGYIQGAPSDNSAANMMSMMMSGQPALQFSNTDAEIWGADLAWDYRLSEQVSVDGVATYVQGKRTDVSDNLYRLAPPNANIGITYANRSMSFGTRLTAYAHQNKVASFNDEARTAGYALLDMTFSWSPSESIRFEAQVNNALNRTYEDHLAGVNRAGGSDIAVGLRLPGTERSINGGVVIRF